MSKDKDDGLPGLRPKISRRFGDDEQPRPKAKKKAKDEPKAYVEGESKAAMARTHVAEQIAELVSATRFMGGRALVVERVRAIAEAEARGDVESLRSAYMDLAVAAGVAVATLDLGNHSPSGR